MATIYTPDLGRKIFVREDTADRQVWADTFTGLYHVPPWIPEPRTVLDVGANIGLTAAHYQTMWPYAIVVAVEMDAGNVALASRNFDGRVIRQAVAGINGTLRYRDDVASDAYSLDGTIGTVDVECRTLDATVARAFGADADCDLVKLDVEGAEGDIVAAAGLWRPYVRRLLVEIHDGEAELRREARDLRDAGYGVVRHERHPFALWAVRE